MNIETVVSDVKDRLQVAGTRAQGVADVSVNTLKQAGDIVVNGVQGLVKTHSEAAVDLIDLSKASFQKVRTDGLKAVVANPIEYLPDGRDAVITAFNETLTTVTKTGEELGKVFKTGYEGVAATLTGEKPARARKARTAAARKAPARKSTARKAPARRATSAA
jgi:hypothetical protein